ncbi:MAG: hypothetical protein ACJ8F7_15970 [Gemmataceae bacterium]
MNDITREQLHAYLEECLPDSDMARIEQTLRHSESLRQQLRQAQQERDRGEHSIGAIWRREALSCPDRDKLRKFVQELLEPDEQDYISFHLATIGCPRCRANEADLRAQQGDSTTQKQRRRKIFKSSAGLLSGKPPR